MVEHLQKMYLGRCDVYELIESIQVNHSTEYIETKVLSDVPCKLSYQNVNTTKQDNINNDFSQSVKLFIDNGFDIKVGSKIVVTQDGVTNTYKCSGKPSVFMAHQEIGLVSEGEA